MPSTVAQQSALDPAVRAFVDQHDAEADLSRVCELVRECFPALVELESSLQADAEEDGRVQVLLMATLPASFPDDELRVAFKRYHERLIEEVPLTRCPLFALVAEFEQE